MTQLIRIPEMQPDRGVSAPRGNLRMLADFVAAHPDVLVITGAGVSTGSGIPAYRDGQGRWLQRRPVLYQNFIGREQTRHRYWARSFIGWPLMKAAEPNPAHHALAALERAGRIGPVITQNVDGLHRRAGQKRLVELHGRLDRVRCLDCRTVSTRDRLQRRLEALNRGWTAEHSRVNADGDVEIDEDAWPDFRPADCDICGGMLKPEVVFFGEAVPAPVRRAADETLEGAGAVLVAGSSLAVGSAYRLVRTARQRGLPIAALNQGRTRADDLLDFKVDGATNTALAALVDS